MLVTNGLQLDYSICWTISCLETSLSLSSLTAVSASFQMFGSKSLSSGRFRLSACLSPSACLFFSCLNSVLELCGLSSPRSPRHLFVLGEDLSSLLLFLRFLPWLRIFFFKEFSFLIQTVGLMQLFSTSGPGQVDLRALSSSGLCNFNILSC